MRAARLAEPRPASSYPLVVQDLDTPTAAQDEVVIEVSTCGVCRTDLQLVEGDLAAHRLPITPGHQVVGKVREVGSGVEDRHVGQRVGVAWIASTCGKCRFCLSGRENLCEAATFTGWDGDGGFAEMIVADAGFTYPLPDGFDDVEAAPLLCGGTIGLRSLRVSGIQRGDRLGLFGFGASATCVIQIARAWECEVFVCTRSVREQQRARDLGAVWAGGYEDSPPSKLDAAITFAPVGSVVVDALRSVDRGGVVAVNAIHLDRIPEFSYDLLWEERQIRSVANVTRRDAVELIELAAEIPIRTQTEVFDLDDVNTALERLSSGALAGAAVLAIS